MNLLVTGGSGFIGTRLVTECVAAGHQVAIYDIAPSVTHPTLCIRGDVRDLKVLTAAAANRDAIIHLAAEHRDDALSTAMCEEVNIGGAENVAAAARQTGCPQIVFTSSVAVYPLDTPQATEADEPRPYNRYGESKLKAERVFQRWAEQHSEAALVIVRPCVVFGEGNRGNVYNLLHQIQRRRFVMVGDGRNRKSMAYVGNLTRFLGECLKFPAGIHCFNYADQPDLSTREIVAFARAQMGCSHGLRSSISLPYPAAMGLGFVADLVAWVSRRRLPVSSFRVRKFCAETTVSVRKLEATGFLRPFSLEDGLRRTVTHEFGTKEHRP